MNATNQTWDIGSLRRCTVRCISETGWQDTTTVFADIQAVGGANTDQYSIPWPPFGNLHTDNAAGFAALLEVESRDGTLQRLLFDTGWNPAWMEQRFIEEGIDEMLRQGEIAALIISHEHFDHFWGIGATLKYAPNITIYVPAGFHQAGYDLMRQQGHSGRVITVAPGEPLPLLPGVALASFPMHTLLQVEGEIVLYAQLAGRGLVMVTGCGHSGVLDLLDYAQRTFGEERIYAIYGGLHIAPLEDWNSAKDEIISALQRYQITQVACNHCTGRVAVEKMLEAGIAVVGGSAAHGSQTKLFVGNGDRLEWVGL